MFLLSLCSGSSPYVTSVSQPRNVVPSEAARHPNEHVGKRHGVEREDWIGCKSVVKDFRSPAPFPRNLKARVGMQWAMVTDTVMTMRITERRSVEGTIEPIAPEHSGRLEASYSDIANRIGSPKFVRAMTQACSANALAVPIPCHRVVRNDGALSGYRWGVELKRTLLEWEVRTWMYSSNPHLGSHL